MKFAIFIEKYSFLLIVLFCLGWFTPNLAPKIAMMGGDSSDSLLKISGGNLKKQLFWISMFVLLIWRVATHNILTNDKLQTLLLVLSLSFLALISVVWSESPSSTFKRSVFQLLFCFCVTISCYYACMHNTVCKCLKIVSYLVVGLTVFTILIGAAFSPGGTLASFANGKNVFGQNMLVLISMFWIAIHISGHSWKQFQLPLVLLLLLLVMSGSKTSIMLVIIFIAFGTIRLELSKLIVFVCFSIFISIFILIPSLSYYLSEPMHIGLYVDPSFLTGRGLIWDMLYYDMTFFSMFELGYGYGAYFGTGEIPWFFDDDWSFLKHIASSHNGYIDTLLQFGIVGATVIFIVLTILGISIQFQYLMAGLMVVVMYNFTESAFFRDQTMIWCFTLFIFALNAVFRNKKRT